MTKTISAYKARVNFGELLNEVYYRGDEFIVERMGKPLVKIVPIKSFPGKNNSIFKLAGIWKDVDVSKLKKEIKTIRGRSSRKIKSL